MKVKQTNSSTDVAFTLKSGYRPTDQVNTSCWGMGMQLLLTIDTNGNVRPRTLGGSIVPADTNISASIAFTTK